MWVVLILLSAFFDSIRSLIGKIKTQKLHIETVAFAQWFFALFLLIPAAIFLHQLYIPNSAFWVILLFSIILNVISTILFWKALGSSYLSLTIPIVSLSPIFLLITSPILTHQFPSLLGIIGIIISVIGTYLLNFSKRIHGFWEPFLFLFKDKGATIMLIVAFIWSITSNLDKLAINNSSPLTYLVYLHLGIVLVLVMYARRKTFTGIQQNTASLFLVGITSGLSLLLQMYALTLAIVPYVLTVKRTNTLFGIVWGKYFLHEDQIKERFIGATIVMIGIGLIFFSH